MNIPTTEQIMKTQGTRLSHVAPWESYAASLDVKHSDQMEAAVAEYATKRHTHGSEESKEALCEERELNEAGVKQYKFIDRNEYRDEAPRMGRIMHSSQLINKLRSCGLTCWYRSHPHKDKLVLMVKPTDAAPEMACWVQAGFAPEYTMVRFDSYGVPVDEKFRGTRTVLLQLIMKGLLREDVANKHFGHATGPAAYRYLKTLYHFRNRNSQWIEKN